MPAVSLRDIVQRLADQPESARLAWLRHVLVDDTRRTQEGLVGLVLAMAQAEGVPVPAEPASQCMRTYVAEINGEAIIAFRADGDDDAYEMVHRSASEESAIKLALFSYARADGSMIWNGEDEIHVRRASDAEHESWKRALQASIGNASDGALIELDAGDDPDDLHVFLIPISDPTDDEDYAAA